MGHIINSDDEIMNIFRKKGLKATPQRIAISRLTLHNHDHLTVEKIYDKVKKQYPTISLTTVYKTINFLKEVGLINELCLPGERRIDPHLDPHMHLVCRKCGSISDWRDPILLKIADLVINKTGFMPEESSADVIGICLECQKKA